MSRAMNDIKAPDGYTLGGPRLVRQDGTILFNRGWWQAPKDWAGQKVWVHEKWTGSAVTGSGEELVLEAANPGLHIYEAQRIGHTVICERTDRADAKAGYRNPAHKAYAARMAPLAQQDPNP